MINTKSTIPDISNPLISNNDEEEHQNDADISDDDAEKPLFSLSEEKIESLTSQSSLSPRENGTYESQIENGDVGNCADTCSSFDGCDFHESDDRQGHRETVYESQETDESESDSENSTEDEDSDDNEPDGADNSIMQERWRELDKYGSSSLHPQVGDPQANGPIYRLAAPINLSASGGQTNGYCLNNPPLHDDSFMVNRQTNSALNMSLRHMSSIKALSAMKGTHLHPMDAEPNYHMIPHKPDSIHCRLPHQSPNILLNNPSLNYDYNKQQRHSLNPHPFTVNEMRSQFHINMMMNNHDNDSLPMPSLSHSHIQDFRCNYCNKCYTNQSSLRSHLKKHMNIDEKKYKCEKCSYSSQYQKNLLKHIHINHEDLTDTQHCRCDICDRMFSSEFLLKDHLRMHTSDNTYQCHQCGKKLKTKLKLRYHADVHNPEKPYVCDIDGCDRAFRTPKYLKNHKDEFHKLQPKKHFCPVENCKLVFQRKSHLKRHMAMHDGEKNYHCLWPDCNRSFRSQETLNVHLIRHTGEKPFKCELCDYSCRQKASLNYHCRNAHAKDCERLLGLKPFTSDCRPPGTRPVGRPPRNRLEFGNSDKNSSKFEGLDENEIKLESQIETDVNGIISHLDKDPNIIDVFKKPAPIDENDFLRKEIFMIVDDVLGNSPREYGDIDEFSLEELCMIELSIKSKRGRKRKVLKELDALLAQNLNENQNMYDEEEDDSGSYKDSINNIDPEEDTTSGSPTNMSRTQYTPSIMQSPSSSTNNSNLSSMNYGDMSIDRLNPELIRQTPRTTPDNHMVHSLINNSPLKLVTNRIPPLTSMHNSSGHGNGVSSFDASYILGNKTNSYAADDQSLSHSNTPMSGQIKAELDDNVSADEEHNHLDSRENSPDSQNPWLSLEPANLICHKRNIVLSPKLESSVNKSLFADVDLKISDESNFLNLQKHFENPLHPLNGLDNLKMNKDFLDQVLDDLKVIQNDEEHKPRPFLSPTSTAPFSSLSNSFKNISELNSSIDNGPKSQQRSTVNTSSLKLLINENNNQPKSLDSSLWSDSGYSSGHDSSGLNKENSCINSLNVIGSNMSLPSICDRNYKMSSPSTNAAAAFIEKTAAAAEMAALSASAALLNSDFYTSYQQNMGNNRSSGESNYSPYDASGFNNELTNMNNICSSMYKSGLEDHLRSLTALGSKYMENNGYPGSNRSDTNPGADMNGMGAFSHLWSSASSSAGDYLPLSSHGPSAGTSLNPFDPANMRNGIEDYCNLAQSPTVAAAADFYSQMTASANYDKYSSLYGCRDSFYDNSTNGSRGLSVLSNGSSPYTDRDYLPSSHPFYPQSASGQYSSRYPPSGASAADYISMGRQFSSGGSSTNPFSVCSDPYRSSVLHNMSPFNRYPF